MRPSSHRLSSARPEERPFFWAASRRTRFGTNVRVVHLAIAPPLAVAVESVVPSKEERLVWGGDQMGNAVTQDDARGMSFRELAALLVLLLALVYIPFLLFLDPTNEGFLWGDAVYYRLAVESLVQDGDLSVENNLPAGALATAVHDQQLAVGASGALVPKHQLLLVFLSYPAYRLLGDKGLLVFNVACVLAVLVGTLALCREWVSAPHALGVAFLFGVATLFLPYVYNFSADLLTTALLVWGVVSVRWRRFFAAAVFISLSVAAKVSSLPAAAAALLLLGWEARKEPLSGPVVAAVACGLALGILPFVGSNVLLFGNPWHSGYSHIAVAAAGGGLAEYSHTTDFTRPLWRGVWDVLCSFPRGLLVSNPLLFAALGFPAVYRSKRDPFLLLLLVGVAAQVLVIAKYAQWDRSAFSNRFLMPAVVFLAPHVALVLEAGVRRFVMPEKR